MSGNRCFVTDLIDELDLVITMRLRWLIAVGTPKLVANEMRLGWTALAAPIARRYRKEHKSARDRAAKLRKLPSGLPVREQAEQARA